MGKRIISKVKEYWKTHENLQDMTIPLIIFVWLPLMWLLYSIIINPEARRTEKSLSEYYRCIDSYPNLKEQYRAKEGIDETINNIHIALVPYVALGLIEDFNNTMKAIKNIAYIYPEQGVSNLSEWLNTIFRGDYLYELPKYFYRDSAPYDTISATYGESLRTIITNKWKLKEIYQYLITNLNKIHDKYPCKEPSIYRNDNYNAYKAICLRMKAMWENTEKTVCSGQIMSKKEWKRLVEDDRKNRENWKKTSIENDVKCKELYGDNYSYSYFSSGDCISWNPLKEGIKTIK